MKNTRDPIRLAQDGEQDGAARDSTRASTDPIRLVRMVKEMQRKRVLSPVPSVCYFDRAAVFLKRAIATARRIFRILFICLMAGSSIWCLN